MCISGVYLLFLWHLITYPEILLSDGFIKEGLFPVQAMCIELSPPTRNSHFGFLTGSSTQLAYLNTCCHRLHPPPFQRLQGLWRKALFSLDGVVMPGDLLSRHLVLIRGFTGSFHSLFIVTRINYGA